MYSFDYVRPTSVADAAKALAANPEARLLAGGQTLIPTLKQRLASPAAVIDIGGIADLRTIKRDGDKLVIGALVTHDAVARSTEVKAAIPALAVLADGIGDPQVRNAGTIGGSVANNDPSADYPSAVLALNATIVTSKRQIPADQYFTGMFSTALDAGEIITAVQFPVPKRAGYAEVRAAGLALCPRRRVRRRDGGRRALRGDRLRRQWRVPLGRGRGGADERLRGRQPERRQGSGFRPDGRHARQRRVPRGHGAGDGRAGRRRGEVIATVG